MNLHREISFEEQICGHLAAFGWLHAEGDSAHYDWPRALFPADLVSWVQETQPKAFDALAKTHGAAAQGMLLDRIRPSSMPGAPSTCCAMAW